MNTPSPTRSLEIKILIVGFGHVGAELLNLALKSTFTNGFEYVVGVRKPAQHRERFNLVHLSSMLTGSALDATPVASLVAMDLDDVAATTATLRALRPDIVINTASRQAWWFPSLLPAQSGAVLAANPVGPSLPNHLLPAMQLQQALHRAGVREGAFTINAAYPDVVNPVLARIGLGYDIGGGNIANPMNAIRAAAAIESGRMPGDVVLRAYGHHAFSYRVTRAGNPAPAPFHIEFEDRAGRPIGLDPLQVFRHLPTTLKRTSGLPGTLMTAASLWTVLRAAVDGAADPFCAPGPLGLEGGWTVRIRDRRVELVSPRTVSTSHCAEVNRQGAVLDGIEAIEDDGTVVFAPGPMGIVRSVLGYSCERMRPSEAAARSDEWMACFRRCAEHPDLRKVA